MNEVRFRQFGSASNCYSRSRIAKAIRLVDEYCQGLHEIIAPDIFPIETLNALAKAERRRRILPGTAFGLWRSIMADSPAYYPHFPLLQQAYDISAATMSAIYDCVYVALAERENCEFITSDDRLFNNLQNQFPLNIHLSTMP